MAEEMTTTSLADVQITINDQDALERVLGPEGDEWRAHLYPLTTREEVLDHWRFNATVNGIRRVNQLDGWADMADDAVTFDVTDAGAF